MLTDQVVYRVNNPKDWYNLLSHDDSALVAGVQQDSFEEKHVTPNQWFFPTRTAHDPSVWSLTSSASSTHAPPAIHIADSTGPIEARPVFNVTLGETLPYNRYKDKDVVLEVTADVSSTTVIRSGGIVEFDLGTALVTAASLGASQWRRNAYGYGATALFIGALKPLVSGKWGVKISWQFYQDTVPVDPYDGCTFTMSVRTYGFYLEQWLAPARAVEDICPVLDESGSQASDLDSDSSYCRL